jgi:hypothetical protein
LRVLSRVLLLTASAPAEKTISIAFIFCKLFAFFSFGTLTATFHHILHISSDYIFTQVMCVFPARGSIYGS